MCAPVGRRTGTCPAALRRTRRLGGGRTRTPGRDALAHTPTGGLCARRDVTATLNRQKKSRVSYSRFAVTPAARRERIIVFLGGVFARIPVGRHEDGNPSRPWQLGQNNHDQD